MNVESKIKKVKKWLDEGYTVRLFGNWDDFYHIVKDGDNYCWRYFGSSANSATDEDLKFILTKIFDENDEFYILKDGKMECTDTLSAYQCNFGIDSFQLWEEDYLENVVTKLLLAKCFTITDLIVHHRELAEQINPNGVRFRIKRDKNSCICTEFHDFSFVI